MRLFEQKLQLRSKQQNLINIKYYNKTKTYVNSSLNVGFVLNFLVAKTHVHVHSVNQFKSEMVLREAIL